MNDKGICTRLGRIELRPGVPLALPIGVLTVADWELAFDSLGPLAASSRNRYLQVVKALDEWGNDTGHLTGRWLTGRAVRKGGSLARRKGAQRHRPVVPDTLDEHGNITDPGEERRLLAVAGQWLQRLIIAALETGCRKGELLSLQWQDVSLARGLVTRAAPSGTG